MVAHAMERARGGHWLPQGMQAGRADPRRARAGLRQRTERLTEADLAGVVPLSEYERRRREAEVRLLALDGQERGLMNDADRQAEAARLAAHAEAFCRRVREGLEQADFGRERELLELLIDRVVVTGEVVEIRYAIPVGTEGEREPFCRLRTDYQGGLPGKGACRGRRGSSGVTFRRTVVGSGRKPARSGRKR
jgi:site-specific DNA recombinase